MQGARLKDLPKQLLRSSGYTYNIIYETSRQSRFDARYWMLRAGALGRPRGMVWGGEREEGGGFRMGNTCIPVADSFRYLAKLIYCKV